MREYTVIAPKKDFGWQRCTERWFRSYAEAKVFATHFVGLPHQVVHETTIAETIKTLNKLSKREYHKTFVIKNKGEKHANRNT